MGGYNVIIHLNLLILSDSVGSGYKNTLIVKSFALDLIPPHWTQPPQGNLNHKPGIYVSCVTLTRLRPLCTLRDQALVRLRVRASIELQSNKFEIMVVSFK